MNIILTRQPAQAGHIEAGLQRLGHTIGYLPLTDFELPDDAQTLHQLDAMVAGLHSGNWDKLLLTSPNTIRALVARGWQPAITEHHTHIAVTGPGTARVLHQHGATKQPWMPQNDASAAGILQQFPAGPGTLALPQGHVAGPAMTNGLTQKGWAVTHAIAYTTVDYPAHPKRALLPPETAALTPNTVRPSDVVILTAPSAARRWANLNIPVAALIAIGQPTARAAQHANLRLTATAPSPDAAGIAAVLPQTPST